MKGSAGRPSGRVLGGSWRTYIPRPIGVHDARRGETASVECHPQCRDDERGALTGGDRPARDLAGTQIQQHREKYPAFAGRHAGDVAYQPRAGRRRGEVAAQQVRGRRSLTVRAGERAASAACHTPDPAFAHDTGHPLTVDHQALPPQRHGDPGRTVDAAGLGVDTSDRCRELFVGHRAAHTLLATPAVEPPAFHTERPAQPGDTEPAVLLDQPRATFELGACPKNNDQLEQSLKLPPVLLVFAGE